MCVCVGGGGGEAHPQILCITQIANLLYLLLWLKVLSIATIVTGRPTRAMLTVQGSTKCRICILLNQIEHTFF